ncbi:DUF572-domain-containing protein [Gloeophyllum trabeum ATCC 11539]|uniref:DUF572-domain-containing protein n=1 Tax=Gloeophyllum trabeum (strain ATCC 11539 / FP-39264 / Madison 617) TaxID=670483 RepID=S7Q2T2_GLOTA|nr:DUF572-domain-containing protein [Gloeophyllum trabeum ATCC 11539]EPQ54306.1 DUF572-domain-containing protein [Gloeophyllum trabeum ATCC 11539]
MQGFNKYYPPDFDPDKHGSLNSYRGKHALGDRARKLDQGILITRFELPFNIWCGHCEAHIGMGVRYNAEKRKVGSYYSTPIYAFRCKCHLCGGWFEIQTDPKSTRYVVTEGARQKQEDWDPEENGGFAVHDTDKAATPTDPLAALEKTTSAQTHMTQVQMPRIEELQSFSEQRSADPYTLSVKVRKRFREQKKVDRALQRADEELKGRYGLPESMSLVRDDEESRKAAKEEWERARRQEELRDKESLKKRRIGAAVGTMPVSLASKSRISKQHSSSSSPVISSLRARILENTARHSSLKPHR